jgi:hypothetical protein
VAPTAASRAEIDVSPAAAHTPTKTCFTVLPTGTHTIA